MMQILKLIRWQNLLIIALVQYLIRMVMIELQLLPDNFIEIPHVLSRFDFFMGVWCSICLAAAGYVVNDIFDQEVDEQNKPKRRVIGSSLSEKAAWIFYGILNVMALVTGYWVARAAGMENLALLPVVAAVLLYLYAVDLKKRVLIGNLIVSLLTALPVLLVGVFDVLPAGNPDNAEMVGSVFQFIVGYACFAFFVNFIREITKDAEDIKGDKNQGYQTLAVVLGASNIRFVLIALGVVLLTFTAYFTYFLAGEDWISFGYILGFVCLPILYFLWLMMLAPSKKTFKKASGLLKLIMLTGIMTMVVFSFAYKLAMT
mgnify:CR=1 FL=1